MLEKAPTPHFKTGLNDLLYACDTTTLNHNNSRKKPNQNVPINPTRKFTPDRPRTIEAIWDGRGTK